MYSFGSYFVAGLAVLLAFEYAAPAGATLAYRDAAVPASFYVVNRAGKGDRLPAAVARSTTRPAAPQAQDKQEKKDAARAKVLVGCDPAFSNLSHHARLNFATRCLS